MNVPDEVDLGEVIVLEGRWKNEWNNPIQIPFVRITDLPKAVVKIIPEEPVQLEAKEVKGKQKGKGTASSSPFFHLLPLCQQFLSS